MFAPDTLQSDLESNYTLELFSKVLAEWNMNIPDNIERLGNYRYRVGDARYSLLPVVYDKFDQGYYYTNATDADVTVDGGMDENNTPIMFTDHKEKMNMLYSLEACVMPNRPRSGINKPLYLGFTGSSTEAGQYLNNFGEWVAHRPRYYMASRHDQFKYWTSYRTEAPRFSADSEPTGPAVERGIAKEGTPHYIDDAAPFVVYKNPVPANAIVVKMQTNVGDTDLGPFRVDQGIIEDPLYGAHNATTPVRWRIEVLRVDSWDEVISFDESSSREDGSPIVPHDGHVEIRYGLHLPQGWWDRMRVVGEITHKDHLPPTAEDGEAYFLRDNIEEIGSYQVWDSSQWVEVKPEYRWGIIDTMAINTPYVSEFVNPDYFMEHGEIHYREFEHIRGIRVAVETMNKANTTFDLIEMSPRLVSDVTERSEQFNITRTLSDLGNASIPVGAMLAGIGSITINNNDAAFSDTNAWGPTNPEGSIIADYCHNNIKLTFWEVYNKTFIPIKTMYSEGFPQSSGAFDSVSLTLRDNFQFLEKSPAPSIFMSDVSLSYAVILLLDYIGFSNYIFKRVEGQTDPVIPHFFVPPDMNVAEVLQQLAIATQSAMFFDEHNNFVVMSKEYMMPEGNERRVDTQLLGQEEDGKLPNIESVSSSSRSVYNSGSINFTARYIQRSYGTLRQSSFIDRYKSWIYKPVMLWEVAPTQNLRTINEVAGDQSAYALAAAPLNTNLPASPPVVRNGAVVNNTIDLGENIYWVTRPQGYFYANGEIIRYDAMEYSVQGVGNVWITNNEEYQRYFSDIAFNGKMYPTGNLRIYSQPYYETYAGQPRLVEGKVEKHGRGQFGTPIVAHYAGINDFWINNDNVNGMKMKSEFIFNDYDVLHYPLGMVQNTPAGDDAGRSKYSSRNSVIKNFMADVHWTEDETRYFNTAQTGTIQSSALVFQGPNYEAEDKPRDFLNYITKSFDTPYRHFGTRMRIIGKTVQNGVEQQKPSGGSNYYTIDPQNPEKSVSVVGGSGGIGVMVDKKSNNGYFFELMALSFDKNENFAGLTERVEYKATSITIKNHVGTVKTETKHSFVVGDKILIKNTMVGTSAGTTALNNEWEVASVSGDGFTFKTGLADVSTPETGVVEKSVPRQGNLSNIVFWKTQQKDGEVVPVKLWGGLAEVLVDEGKFTGQQRMASDSQTTVYDLDVEYKDFGSSRTFYLYVNGKQVATVVDDEPLNQYNTACLFVRGTSKCMFENFYALSENFSQNTISTVVDQISEVFGDEEINSTEALRKYAMSGFVQASYLSGISAEQPPQYNMYFEEFGTIMREAAYINAQYDQAYPALYAQISPTFNRVKGYVTSGFYAGAYGAEFLVFNATDKTINLDATTGNYLRIQGVTFTQNTTKTLTVDDYYKKVSNLADPPLQGDVMLYDPRHNKELYDNIKLSRMKYGRNEFNSIESIYIQDDDTAEDILGWVVNKSIRPRKIVGVSLFGMPHLQLGDIVTMDYKNYDGHDVVIDPDSKMVVYSMEYNKSAGATNMTAYLVEV